MAAYIFGVPNFAIWVVVANSFGKHISPGKRQMRKAKREMQNAKCETPNAKCKAASQAVGCQNYMQLRSRGRGMRLVKQKCRRCRRNWAPKNWVTTRLPDASRQPAARSSATVKVQQQERSGDVTLSRTLEQSFGFTLVVAPIFATTLLSTSARPCPGPGPGPPVPLDCSQDTGRTPTTTSS